MSVPITWVNVLLIRKLILSVLLSSIINIVSGQTNINKHVLTIMPSIFGWYKVTESSNIHLWSIGSNIQISGSSNSNIIVLTGFTNVGASLKGYIKNNKIIFPHQTNTIFPFGGGHSSKFDIVAKAKGIIKNGCLILQFYRKTDSLTKYNGEITAIRLQNQDTIIEN